MQNFTQTGLGRRRLWCFYRDETGTGYFPNWGAHSWEAAERNWGLVLENEGIGCAAEGSEEVRNVSLLGGAIFSSKTMLCQDRLGTNIMKTNMKQTKRRFLSGEARLPALKGCKCYRRRRRLRRPALP